MDFLMSAPQQFFQSGPVVKLFADSVAGSDANPGTLAAPVKTVARVVALDAITPASEWNFKKDSIFREACILPRAGMTAQQYGTGTNFPLFACDDIIAPGAWTKTAGFTNIYQCTVTTDNVGGFLRLWENNVSFVRAATQAALDTTASAYTVSGDPGGGATSFTMFVHTSDGTNPGVNGKTYEYNRRAQGMSNADPVSMPSILNGIWARRNLSNNGSIEVGPGSNVNNFIAEDGTKHNCLVNKNSVWSNGVCKNSYYAGQSKIACVINDNSPAPTDNVTLNNIQYTEAVEGGGAGFYGHTNVSGKYGTITLNNCSTSGSVLTAIAGFVCDNARIIGGSFVGGINCGGVISDFISHCSFAGQISIAFLGNIELDTVTASGTVANGIVRSAAAGTILNIHDCTLSNGTAFDGPIYFDAVPGSVTLLRTNFPTSVQSNFMAGAGTNAAFPAVIDFNTYHHPAGVSCYQNYGGSFYDLTAPATLASWRALGFDANCTVVAP